MDDLQSLKDFLKMKGNSMAVENYLVSSSLVFRSLRNKLTFGEIMSSLFISLSACDDWVDRLEWADEKHMRLKQLTQTPLISFTHMCDVLKFSFSEAISLSNNNVTLIRIANELDKTFLGPGGLVMSPNYYVSVFKNFSISIKQNSASIPNWFIYTDMETWVGYNLLHPMSASQKADVAKTWCKGDVDRGEHSSWYNDTFYKAIVKRLDAAVPRVRDKLAAKSLPVREFVMNISPWMTDGSSRGVRTDVYQQGRGIKSRAKKQVLALKYSTSEILSKMFVFSKSETYSVSEKIEPGRKKRCIISAPFIQQIRLSYLEYKLKPLFRAAFEEIFYLDNNIGQTSRHLHMLKISRAAERTYTMFPLDASSFDQFVSKEEVTAFFLALRFVCQKYRLLTPLDIDILDVSLHAFFNSDVVIDKSINIGVWQHGIPSGVRWTALLDSVINAARFDVCIAWHRKFLMYKLSPRFSQFQGDDMIIILHNLCETLSILHFYDSFNIPIHPYKNFVSFSSFEFLRKIYQREVCGYPARTITKFLFRLPENRGASDNHSLLLERVNSIQRARSRYLSPDSVLISRVSRIIHKMRLVLPVVDWLIAPTCLGGGGVLLGSVVQRAGSRTKILRTQWPVLPKTNVTVRITGVYNELISSLNILKTPMLEGAMADCLDPSPPTNWDTNVSISWYEYKAVTSFNRKLNLSNPDYRAETPWMPTDRWLNAILPDHLAMLERNNDVVGLRLITNIRCLDNLDRLVPKASPNYLWAWVTGRLPQTTFNSNLIIDVCRAQISSSIDEKLTRRFIATHKNINLADRLDIILYSYSYLYSNLQFILSLHNNFVIGND
ncbi:putative RdRP [Lampyris noctiluca toti-like virus 1]|nr:putative RdRP [Lampyris noctiluca toti-like virus 1]